MIEKEAFINFLKTAADQGATGEDVAALIKESSGEQVDPQELEALMAHLSQGGGQQDPSAGGAAGGMPPEHPAHAHHGKHQEAGLAEAMGGQEDPTNAGGVEGLPLSEEQLNHIAELVAQHIGASAEHNPDMSGMSPDHQQGLAMAKTSEYIGSFIKRAQEHGLQVEDAVNLYGNSLLGSIELCKAAALKQIEINKVAAETDEDVLAYFQGIVEKAASENLTYDQTLDLLGKSEKVAQLLKEKFTNNK